jgi:hypothetical protein
MTWMPNDISIWTSGLRLYYDKSLLQLGLHTLLQRTAAQTLQTAPSHGPRPFGSTCPDEMLMFSYCGKCMKMCELCSPRVSRRTLKLKASCHHLGDWTSAWWSLVVSTRLNSQSWPQHPELLSCCACCAALTMATVLPWRPMLSQDKIDPNISRQC